MEALVIFLCITSTCFFSPVHGRTGNHHHHHQHTTNHSIALPPMADSPDESAVPPTSSGNSTNSTSIFPPPPSPIALPPTTSSPPKPSGNSTNSTSLPPLPSPIVLPPTSSPNSTNSSSIPPPPSPFVLPPTSSPNSTNSTSLPPLPSPIVLPPTSSPNSTNSTSLPPLPSPIVLPPTSSPNSTNSSSIPPLPSPIILPPTSSTNSTNSSSIPPLPPPIVLPPTSSPNSTNSSSIPPLPSPIVLPPTSSPNSTNTSSIPPLPSPAPSPANGIITVFNVRSFGAVGNGLSDDTEAFKSAWDSACQSGSAVVHAPRGYSFMIRSTIFAGPCQDGVIFQVDGIVMPPDGPESWPQNNSKRQWLVFYRADGMTMRGAGLIDGRGQKWWDLPCKPHRGVNGTTLPGPCDSPVALRFFMSSNLSVHGLKIQNSPQFHFRFDNCRNVTVDSISISSPALSPNTDGIHVENTNTVGIYNSVISNGDDCISIGSGSLNVDIRNVTCGPGHGISIGSLGKLNSHACVANVTVRNAIIKHSDNGVRIKTWQGGSGSVSSITFDNIRMDTVRNPIMIDQYYCLSKPCTNKTTNIFISDISYSGIKGTYDARGPPIHLGCSDSVPCTNITLTDVELLPAQGYVISDPFCWNVYGASPTLTIPPVACLLEGLPKSIMEYGAEKCY